jgi:acetyltransferase-like isoleucine patch superfamily enzyme
VISGHVKVGPYSFLGVNSTLRDGISIGAYNVIGAGALVMKDTADKELYTMRRTYPNERSTDEIDF